jgi:hypothetical protein
MAEEFVTSEPIGDSDEPNSPIYDEAPPEDSLMAATGTGYCTLNGKKYKEGAQVCGNNHKYTCRNGNWVMTEWGSCPPGMDIF